MTWFYTEIAAISIHLIPSDFGCDVAETAMVAITSVLENAACLQRGDYLRFSRIIYR